MPTPIGNMPADIYYHNGCARCGRADNCFDSDVTIEYEGGIAFCRGCIADLALAAGLTPPAGPAPKLVTTKKLP